VTENPQFRVVLRGYEPAQVDRRLEELSIAVHEAARQRDDLLHRLTSLEEDRARRAAGLPEEPPTYDHLGERIAQILKLAEEEAVEIRRRASLDIEGMQGELGDLAAKVRTDADRYAAAVRGEAEAEAERVLAEARRSVEERLEAAERDAAARLEEAAALLEEQRARTAEQAAEFETLLASRRKAAEAEFSQQLGEATSKLEQSAGMVDEARSEAERQLAQAEERARRIVEDAELQAATIISDAKAMATRIRADSERELIAATQRRDSINAQLANVRQMLATLTGSSPVPGQIQPGHDLAMGAAD